ncbi:Predicted phosphohydrolase or phosphomutase, AlkP superfamily [Halogeometricum rufum]|uniref:Predicted phosphohydrolase or phosphomutase, AlkP superfamily n=1 Tax=Halogeometricum rufum TaxID=553469 RepID=A0A1I6H0U6_9EURY|nr:alkaline phosphatase family protein [Halogeometricum rufum]SFR48048.1 Predicted phosphohydrolase or phosphomutase, AlkP superfamily [Halogeometricum rufum]
MRALLVGLDAACLPVLEPLFEADAVPTLQSLFDDGVAGPLESQIPPWTASAWPSMYTGKNPGKHGVFDFLSFDGYDWDIVNGTDLKARTVWDYLHEAGLTSVVVNAPVTDPPRDIDGAVVPGYLAHNDPRCHPEGLLDELREELGGYQVYANRETDETVDDAAKFREYVRLTESRGEAFRYLADRFDPDFGFVQFQKTDAVFHDFPGDLEKVREIYETVDAELERILDEFDPDNVVVASDHGMGEYDGYEVRVNELLRRGEYTETTTDGHGVPSWFQIKDEQLVEDDTDGESDRLQRLARAAGKAGLTYQRGKAILERLGLAEFVGRHVPVSAVFAASETVDFAESVAYLRSSSELGVRLNVAGRDPDGKIPPAEYESVRSDLVEFLSAQETPDGDPVFEDVVPREEYIHGPFADDAVDVLCVPADFEHSLSMIVDEPFVAPEPWNHKLEGVVALRGDDVDSAASLDGAHLFDVAPTLLSLFGVAPATDMDGESLGPVTAVPPESYDEFEPRTRVRTDDDDVTERLADLGYLE